MIDPLGQAVEQRFFRTNIQPQIGLPGFFIRPVTLETVTG